MNSPEHYNLLAAVKTVHRTLGLVKLASLGIEVSHWDPDLIIESHGNSLGAGMGVVAYDSEPVALTSPLCNEGVILLKDSHASFDLGRERFRQEWKINPNYGDSVKRLVHEVEESVFILNVLKPALPVENSQALASIFLMPDTPPFAVHDDDLQYVWDGLDDALDVDLLPKLDAFFEGTSQVQLDKNQCGAIVTALAASRPRFCSSDEIYDL